MILLLFCYVSHSVNPIRSGVFDERASLGGGGGGALVNLGI